MSDLLFTAGFVLSLVLALLILPAVASNLWYRSHRRKARGVHFSLEAAHWAESRFPKDLQPVAAFVADLLCQQLGVGLAQLEPQSRFVDDLDMTDLEPVEVLMALEEELGIEIAEEESESLQTVETLVSYLHQRLYASHPKA